MKRGGCGHSLISVAVGLVALGSVSVAGAVAFTQGNLIVSGTATTVKEITPSGTLVQTLPSAGSGFTTGMCFDASGNLLVTMFTDGALAKYSNTGALVDPTFMSAPGQPEACVRDAAGNFYVTSVSGVAAIRKFSPTGTLLQSYIPGKRSDWLDLAADQCTMYWDDEGQTSVIHRHNVCTDTDLGPLGGNGQYTALRVLPGSGDIIVANGAASSVERFSPGGTLLGSWLPAGGSGTVFSLNLDPDGVTFWTGTTDGDVFRFALSGFGSQITMIDSGNAEMYGVAVVGEITVAIGGLSINNVSKNEGSGGGTTPFVFTVTLSQASQSTVTVNYATANGTALEGSDYAATSGTLTFNPGDMSKTITVQVTADNDVESNETFFVNLSNPVNATISQGQGTGTIVNDDSAVVVVNVPTVNEWMLAVIGLLLAASATLALRRRR